MLSITISGEEYIRCSEYSKNNWSRTKPGVYGKGLGNTGKDISKIERVSKLAELAVAKLLGTSRPDFAFKRFGDNGVDLLMGVAKIDVKCAMRDYGANVFRGINKTLRSTVKSDLYIFCYLDKEVREYNTARINIVGYLTKEDILKLPLVQPRKKFTTECVNYDIAHSNMNPIEQLVDKLESSSK